IAATRLSFCGETRRLRATACTSFSGRRRSPLGLPILPAPRRFLVAAVAMEGARRRELAELVPDHVLVDGHGNMLLAVVNAERQPDELRQDRRTSRPNPDDLAAARRAHLLGLLQDIAVDERAFPNRACHDLLLRCPVTCSCGRA